MAERIQRRRTRGWRMPPGAVYVGRPTRWGNRFRIVRTGTLMGEPLYEVRRPDAGPPARVFLGGDYTLREASILAVTAYRLEPLSRSTLSPAALATLTGHDLACWCPLDQPCHADVLLEIANQDEL